MMMMEMTMTMMNFIHVSMYLAGANRPFSKMVDENSNKLKLAKIKNVYQHYKEHVYFSNPGKFQNCMYNISRENLS